MSPQLEKKKIQQTHIRTLSIHTHPRFDFGNPLVNEQEMHRPHGIAWPASMTAEVVDGQETKRCRPRSPRPRDDGVGCARVRANSEGRRER